MKLSLNNKTMIIEKHLLKQIRKDLKLDVPFVRGQSKTIENCWHFSTDGTAVDWMFADDDDFVAGMNRIYVCLQFHKVIILAFALMDTHVHFVLYGDFDECNRFVHDYVRRTSRHIALRHGCTNKFRKVSINHQVVDNDYYLKIVICYTIKNPPVGGLPFNYGDYPWSSGPLYFRKPGLWSSPNWLIADREYLPLSDLGVVGQRETLRTRRPFTNVQCRMVQGIVFPGDYVAFELVEEIFKSCKSFNYFLCLAKESEVDARGGAISRLTVPDQEMRQYKSELCLEMFGKKSTYNLATQDRIRLARALRAKYNSSIKQIARVCGLVYDEVKTMI